MELKFRREGAYTDLEVISIGWDNQESMCSERGPREYPHNRWTCPPQWHCYSSLGWCLLSLHECIGAAVEVINSNAEKEHKCVIWAHCKQDRKTEGLLENGRKHAWFKVIKLLFCPNTLLLAKQNKIAARFCQELLVCISCQACELPSLLILKWCCPHGFMLPF